MPVMNGARFIKRALSSIQNQTFSEIEIVISDNDSSDATLAIAQQVADRDDRVRVLSGERVSASANFARVLDAARSDFVCWAAFDDYWHEDFAAAAHKQLAMGNHYFVPNWWVGQIAKFKGSSPDRNPLSFLQSPNAAERTFNFVNLHHMSHKCNLVYAMYRREFLQDRFQEQDISDDGAFCANVAYASDGAVSDRLLFWKDFRGTDLRYYARKILAEVLPASQTARLAPQFDAAKLTSLATLCRLWPRWCREFEYIYQGYQAFPRSHLILPEDTLRVLVDNAQKRGP